MSELVKVRREDDVALVSLNRPESFNAFNLDMIGQLEEHLISLAGDSGVRAVVITGEGKAFCAGGDLKWVLSFPKGAEAGFHELAARFHQAVLEIRRMRKPVIAAINGVAAGGGFSLALACDFRVMARSAVLRLAYTSVGLCVDGGCSYSLPRLVGLARALEIAAFDKPISSEQALAWGLVTKVVDDGSTLDEALKMAHQLAEGPINAFALTKRLFTDSFDTPFETQIERERMGINRCGAHPEGMEGIRAFVEKRKPAFKGK